MKVSIFCGGFGLGPILVGSENLFVGDVFDRGSRDTLVFNDTKKLVATTNLKGMVVMDDTVLVCGKDGAPGTKALAEDLEAQGRVDLV